MIDKMCLASRILLGTVFLLSGVFKLISPNHAAELLKELSTLDLGICVALVVGLCFFEMALAVALFVGKKYLQATAFISSAMLLLFTFVGVMMVQSPKSCGCFGDVLDLKTDGYFVARNFVLLFVSMFVLKFSSCEIVDG